MADPTEYGGRRASLLIRTSSHLVCELWDLGDARRAHGVTRAAAALGAGWLLPEEPGTVVGEMHWNNHF